jgi:hypothetical protein
MDFKESIFLFEKNSSLSRTRKRISWSFASLEGKSWIWTILRYFPFYFPWLNRHSMFPWLLSQVTLCHCITLFSALSLSLIMDSVQWLKRRWQRDNRREEIFTTCHDASFLVSRMMTRCNTQNKNAVSVKEWWESSAKTTRIWHESLQSPLELSKRPSIYFVIHPKKKMCLLDRWPGSESLSLSLSLACKRNRKEIKGSFSASKRQMALLHERFLVPFVKNVI